MLRKFESHSHYDSSEDYSDPRRHAPTTMMTGAAGAAVVATAVSLAPSECGQCCDEEAPECD